MSSYLDGYYPASDWRYAAPVDHRFFSLVKEMAVAMSDRCQDGLLDPESFGKTVVAAAGCVMAEYLYVSGERKRPISAEERSKEIDRLVKEMSKR